MHILIVEDDEDIADLVSFKLEKQGWQTTQVHRGDEAPERIAALLPDMVILLVIGVVLMKTPAKKYIIGQDLT